ncbi:MAG TPA: primosomal protein N' [Thermoanaerobacterales bacterium]|nr:primosomal protein N' [Thermoanaerobacterales bacterium]
MPGVALVAVDVKHPDARKEYSYLIPDDIAVNVGDVVQVNFNSSRVNGVITGLSDGSEVLENVKMKYILKKESITLSPEFIGFCRNLAVYYGSSLIDFLKLMLPPPASKKREIIYAAALARDNLPDKATNQKKVWELVLTSGALSAREISQRTGLPISSVQAALTALVKKKLLIKSNRIIDRKQEMPAGERLMTPLNLTEEQALALKKIFANFDNQKKPVLLYGVTGSGKTEVYIRTIEKVINQGKKAIILVPEISLTPQMLAIFQTRFPGRVAVIHSRLSAGERFDEWHRIYDGQADVVIGARSAIFAPVKNLGLIIVDEEHESSYKQAEHPYYDARTAAILRARMQKAQIIFGSATPSVESYYKVASGEYMLVKMTRRASGMPLPKLEVVDMREELKAGNRHIFSRKLVASIKQILSSGRQAILFLNRRGHSTFVICRDCGFVMKCPHCDISLTYHFDDRSVKCHYCGYHIKAPDICPLCGSSNIRYFGAGTEKVEQEVYRLFPGVKALRIDADTISKKGSLEHILSSFRKGDAQILIGTQVVAKGLDFPKVSLVGVITADTALNMPDFRAGERTFQLITQVAGRAGRAELPGKVLVQTYCPESFAVKAACEKDITKFYQEELKNRRKSNYPPFCHLLNIILTGSEKDMVEENAAEIKNMLCGITNDGLDIYGPAPAPRYRVKDNYRYHVLLKSKKVETLIKVEDCLKSMKKKRGIKVAWDMDPQDLL